MNGGDALLDEIISLKARLLDLSLRHYYARELFSWVWWLGIACIFAVAGIWWKAADKKRLLELGLFGLIVCVSALFLDVAGTEMVMWIYPIGVFLPLPILFPVDFVILPAIDSFVYQKYPAWGKYLIVCSVTAAFLSFGFEPFAIWIGQYKLIIWRLVYSFPIYVLIDVFSKFATQRILARQSKSTCRIKDYRPE